MKQKELFFQYHRCSACVDADYDIKESIKILNKQCNEHFMNTFTINKACWQRGAFHSEKSVRDFSDFKNPRIFNGFSPDFLRIFRDKNPQNFHDFSPAFEHFRSDIFLDYFPNKNHLLSFTVFN